MTTEKDMYSIAGAADALADSVGGLEGAMSDLADSKTWGIISRMSSGIFSQFWAIQNKFRAITVMFQQYFVKQRKQLKAQLAAIQASSKLKKMMDSMPKDSQGRNAFLKDDSKLRGVALKSHSETLRKGIEEYAMVEDYVTKGKGAQNDADRRAIIKELKIMMGPQLEELQKQRKILEQEYEDRINEVTKREKFVRWTKKKQKAATDYFKGTMDGTSPFVKNIESMATGFGKFMAWFTVIILFIYFFYNTIKSNANFFGKLFSMIKSGIEGIVSSAGMIIGGFSDILNGIINGDLMQVLEGVLDVALGILGVVFWTVGTLIVTVLGTIAGLLIGGFFELLDAEKRNGAQFVSAILQLVGWAAAIGALFLYITSGAWIVTAVVAVASLIGATLLGQHATGGTVSKPLQLVGERGPELVALPRGSRVYTNSDSQKMLGGGGGNTINVHVNGRVGASDAEIRDIADKVGREINLRMNRTANSQVRF